MQSESQGVLLERQRDMMGMIKSRVYDRVKEMRECLDEGQEV